MDHGVLMMNTMMKLILCAASMFTIFNVDAAADEGESHYRWLDVYGGEISSSAVASKWSRQYDLSRVISMMWAK